MIIVDRHHLRTEFRAMRINRKLSQRDLADALHVTQQTITTRERRRRASMEVEVAIQTAAVFGYDLALIPTRHPGARTTGTGWPA